MCCRTDPPILGCGKGKDRKMLKHTVRDYNKKWLLFVFSLGLGFRGAPSLKPTPCSWDGQTLQPTGPTV